MENVYRPREDSTLLATVAKRQITDGYVLEVGTGSGFVAKTIRQQTQASVIGSDINPHACEMADSDGIDVVRTNLSEAFQENIFDWVLFNPPYLPKNGNKDGWIWTALESADNGTRVTKKFVETVERVLNEQGRVLLVLSSKSETEQIREVAVESGFSIKVVDSTSLFFERLEVVELYRD